MKVENILKGVDEEFSLWEGIPKCSVPTRSNVMATPTAKRSTGK